MKKKILCVSYSNSGQTDLILRHLLQPLEDSVDVDLQVEKIKPLTAYPFPWTLLSFFSVFPEAIQETPCEIEEPFLCDERKFDLVVLAYPVWFLSVAIPMMSFLKSQTAHILEGADVITVVTCRSMWSQAQICMQKHLRRLGSRLIGHVSFIDRSGNKPITFISTPLWLITGRKKVSRYIPEAGVAPETIRSAGNYGRAMLAHLGLDAGTEQASLCQSEAPTTTATSEIIGKSIFRAWALLIGACSKPNGVVRKVFVVFFMACLFGMALTFLPAWVFLVKLGQTVGVASATRQVVRFAGEQVQEG
jgi:hypothetical protein